MLTPITNINQLSKGTVIVHPQEVGKRKVLALLEDLVFVTVSDTSLITKWETCPMFDAPFHISRIIDEGYQIEVAEEKLVPEDGNMYWYVDSFGVIDTNIWGNSTLHRFQLSTDNVFPYTEEGKQQAEQYRTWLIENAGKWREV